MAATRDDWETTPLPAARAAVPLDRAYTAAEFERLKAGHVPPEMEDKWFAFYEAPWLYLHRSWTGFGVFQVRFAPAAGGARVAEAWASRDPAQYTETDPARDALLLTALLDGYAGREAGDAWERWARATPTRTPGAGESGTRAGRPEAPIRPGALSRVETGGDARSNGLPESAGWGGVGELERRLGARSGST